MTRKLTRDTVFYAFSADLEPALEIELGEKVQMGTHDCFCGRMQSEADTIDDLDWGRVNPATGPVYIRGAQPGDVLAVEIEDVKVADQGEMVAIPGEGALGDVITEAETRIFRMEAVRVPQVYLECIWFQLGRPELSERTPVGGV